MKVTSMGRYSQLMLALMQMRSATAIVIQVEQRTMKSLTGLPPGQFPLDIFGMVLNGITVRGSIVGTHLDLQESLDFAAQGKVEATVFTDKLENINDAVPRLHGGRIKGRVVLDLAA